MTPLSHARATTPLDIFQVVRARRAVRAYSPEVIDEPTIHTLLDAAVQAPTAVHLEPWAFTIVQDRATLGRISDRAKALLTAGVAHSRPDRGPGTVAERHLALLTDPGFNIFYDAGTLIVICARPLGPFVTADCWLAAENFMLAACGLGLGTCVIGLAVAALNTPEVKAELAIPSDVTAVAPIIVGVPSSPPPPVSRKAPVILSWRRPA